MKGIIHVTLRDKETGEVIRRGSHRNTVTDIWRMRNAILTSATGSAGVALRGVSKPDTGQYNATLSDNTFGIYALNENVTIDNSDVIPPYVDVCHQAINDKVAFYNVNNAATEDAMTMLAADPRCVFSYDPSVATYTSKYVKNSGEARIHSIMFGRDFLTPQALQGYLLGENTPSVLTTGTANYFLEHRIDRTRIWKTVNASSSFSYDFLDKTPMSFTAANLNANIANASLTGGLVIGNTVVKVIRTASTATSVTVQVTAVHNFTTATTITTRNIVFDGVGLDTNRIHFPVLVARPDLTAFEVFMPMEVANGKCLIKKATITNFADGVTGAAVDITDAGETDYLISQNSEHINTRYCTGYYNVQSQQYWLPYGQRVVGSGSDLVATATANYQPGVVMNSSLTNVIRHYYARTGNNVHSPVLTNHGLLLCRANTTTCYYFWGSGIIAGANFADPYDKTAGNILEVVYEFSFS